MRSFKNYSLSNFLLLSPFIDMIKEFRNDFFCNQYIAKASLSPLPQEQFVSFKNKPVIGLVAFNVPQLIEWSLKVNMVYLKEVNFMVFDNSSNLACRKEIQKICEERKVPYVSLPINVVKHPSRSHGLALSWIFNNVIKKMEPSFFGFIDHDLFALQEIDLVKMMSDAPFYGVLKESPWSWNLWAGFSFYRYEAIKPYPLNFLNDRPNGLDTGGRNWHVLYTHFNKGDLAFPTYERRELTDSSTGLSFDLDLIDEKWLHFRGAYTTNYGKKIDAKKYSKSELIEISERVYESFKLNS